MRFLLALVMSITASTVSSSAASPPAQVRALLDQCHQHRLNNIELVESALVRKVDELRNVKSANINRLGVAGTFRTRKDKDARVNNLKDDLLNCYKRLVELRVGSTLNVPWIDAKLPIGSFGTLYSPVLVQQVIDDSNALVYCIPYDPESDEPQKHLIWLKGFSTSAWVDDKVVQESRDWVVRVVSNKTYSSASGGSNTVLLVEKIDLTEAIMSYVATPLPAFVDRAWTASAGKSTVTATLVGYQSGKATLKKANGQVVSVSPSQLSTTDQDYLKTIALPRLSAREHAARELKGVPGFEKLQASLAQLEARAA